MKKIIQYDSKLNTMNFGKFKEKELDLFFSICYKMKNEGVNEVVLTFQELKELSKYSRNDLKRFVKDLENTYTKLLDLKLEIIISPKIREKIVLFTRYRIDEERKEITIQLHKEYNFILNDISKFTKFDLMEFVNIKSSYAKNVFKLLKQFDNANSENWYQIELEQFKTILNVPSSYKISHIDSFILNPVLEQLQPYFKGLKLEKIKKGVKVDSLKFTWKTKREKKEKVQPIKQKSSLGEKELQEHENINKIVENLEKEKDIKTDQVEKIEISKEKYDKLYKEYLEKIGENHNLFIKKSFDFINKDKYNIIK